MRHLRAILVALTVVVALPWWAEPQIQREAIPFVGCPANGQIGPIEAPHGTPKVVPLDSLTARQIAYYKGHVGPGVFAPRGWHCRVWYGSAGSTLLVTPTSIDSANVQKPQIHGHPVELESRDGTPAGRFEAAA